MKPALRGWALALPALVGAIGVSGSALALNIVPTYDSSIQSRSDGATVMATLGAAVAKFNAKISDNTTVTITFYDQTTGLGNSGTFTQQVPWYNFVTALRNHGSSLDDAVALGLLPDGPNPVDGSSTIRISTVLQGMLGLASAPQSTPEPVYTVLRRSPGDPLAANDDVRRQVDMMAARIAQPDGMNATPDGSIYLNLNACNVTTGATPSDKYSLTSVAEHEIDEVLGSNSRLTGGVTPTASAPEDLFRYGTGGWRSFSTSSDSVAWFSLDGRNLLVRFNQAVPGDFSDWWSGAGHTPRVQDASGTQGADPEMGVEWQMLDAIGWSYAPRAVWLDFNYGGMYFGLYDNPFNTLSQAIANIADGGAIFVKAGGVSSEHLTITKPLTLTSVGGITSIGMPNAIAGDTRTAGHP